MIRTAWTGPKLPAREDLGSLTTLWRTKRSKIFPPLGAAVMLVATGAVAACGSSAASSASASGAGGVASGTASMATSIATPGDDWAVVPMSSDPAFWEVFERTSNSGTWQLVTPPGVADNGGLVASAGAATSLTIAVRPSQDLLFSPLAATANGGTSWSTGGPVNAAVAASPDAFAADGSYLAALLSDGTIETSSDAGATWSTLAKPGAIAASPAAKGCGAVRVTSLSFGITSSEVLAGGTCGTSGTTAIFSYSSSTGWQRESLPVAGPLVRLGGGTALVEGKAGLTELAYGFGWYAYAPLAGATPQPAPRGWDASAALSASGPVTASGTLPAGGSWVLLSGGRAATIGGPSPTTSAAKWTLLPPVPAQTTVLAAGPGGAVDALAVSGTTLTVWQLAPKATAWSKVQAINVPIQTGSSS
jgi:hypothetical protein